MRAPCTTAYRGQACCPKKSRAAAGCCRAWPTPTRTSSSATRELAQGAQQPAHHQASASIVARAVRAARHVLVLAVGDGFGLRVRTVLDRVAAFIALRLPTPRGLGVTLLLRLAVASVEVHAATLGSDSRHACRTKAMR